MDKYNITDVKITQDIKDYLSRHLKAKKEQVFKYLVRRYGIMDRDDFNFNWTNQNP